MTRERFDEITSTFPSLAVAVYGDFYLDKYLEIDPDLAEPSLETGLTARQVVGIRCAPGAAGTIAANLSSMGVGRVHAIGGIGHDGEGFDLTQALRSRRIDTRGLVVSQQFQTPTYIKPIENGVELERLDIQNRERPRKKLVQRALDTLESLLPGVGAVVVADQSTIDGCGIVSAEARERLASLSQQFPDVVFLADSRAHIRDFPSMYRKPNLGEAARACGEDPPNLEHVEVYGLELADIKPLFITAGKNGMYVCYADATVPVPTAPAAPPIDVTGAGDAAAAALAACLAAGTTAPEAAEVGNLAAGVTIKKLGMTGTASRAEIRQCLE